MLSLELLSWGSKLSLARAPRASRLLHSPDEEHSLHSFRRTLVDEQQSLCRSFTCKKTANRDRY
ncbi:hypothetical protein ACSS6W_002811 [Trichoderma asperelloides]